MRFGVEVLLPCKIIVAISPPSTLTRRCGSWRGRFVTPIGFGRAKNIGKRDHANVILRDDEARAGSLQLLVGGFDHLPDEREYPFLPLSERSALQAGKLLEGLPLSRRLFFRPLFLRPSTIPGCSQSALELLGHCGDFSPSCISSPHKRRRVRAL